MSRRFTLEDYLEEFMDQHTEPAENEIRILVSDAQVQRVGLFFIECMGGIIQCLRSESGTATALTALPAAQDDQRIHEITDEVIDEANREEDDFSN